MMKIGNAPLPISERLDRQNQVDGRKVAARDEKSGARTEEQPAFKVELSGASEKLAEGGITSAEEALRVASATRDMIAQNNREAADVQQNLDPKRLLDLLA